MLFILSSVQIIVNLLCIFVCFRIATTDTPQWNRKFAWLGVISNLIALIAVFLIHQEFVTFWLKVIAYVAIFG